MRILQNFLYDN